MRTDFTRDAALTEFGTRLEQLVHGRLVLVVEKLEGSVADWWVDEDRLTSEDYDRLMRQRPREVR